MRRPLLLLAAALAGLFLAASVPRLLFALCGGPGGALVLLALAMIACGALMHALGK